MKVLFINLPYARVMKINSVSFPIGLGYLAAVSRRAGYQVQLYDMERDKRRRSFRKNSIIQNK